VCLVDRKPQLQHFHLSVVAVKQITARHVLSRTAHILSDAVKVIAFLDVGFGVFLVRGGDPRLDRVDPIHFIRLFQWNGYKGRGCHGSCEKKDFCEMASVADDSLIGLDRLCTV
jgi:hypothetical protein